MKNQCNKRINNRKVIRLKEKSLNVCLFKYLKRNPLIICRNIMLQMKRDDKSSRKKHRHHLSNLQIESS